MPTFFFTLLLTTLAFSSYAQDTIRQLSGERIVAKVIANKQNSIEFTYPGETSYNTLPKSLINYIAYSSGRKESVSQLIDTKGEEGWKNVLITINPDEVAGLVRVGEVRAKANNMANLANVAGVDSKATEKIQKEAASLGAHIILMLQNNTKGMSYGTAAQSFKSGIAYTYPFKTIDGKSPYTGSLARRYYGVDKSEKAPELKDVVGKKVLFDYEGEIYEGEILKQYGNFYKIKFTNKKGKEVTTSEHVDKVELANQK